jgi:pimeloyl-ACP methyl ester carboxylesterase
MNLHQTLPSRIPRRSLLKRAVGIGALAAAAQMHLQSPRRVAAAPATPSARAQRGTLLSVTPLDTLDTDQVSQMFAAAGLDTSRVRNGIAAYRIEYATIDAMGEPTTASALAALPQNEERDLRTVAWLHGTTVYRGDVASVSAEGGDRLIAFAFAAAGYAVAAPDYLGLGAGPGYHPFRDPSSEVTASVDALRATRALAEQEGRQLDARVLVSGFSQGGPAAMALGRALQLKEGADASFGLGALAPIGGPFDMSGTFSLALTNEIDLAAAYLAYLVVAWNRLHHLYDSPSEAFQAPYDATIETLFDGEHTGEEILPALPGTPAELFTPAFMDRLQHPSGTLQAALDEANSTCDWRPDVPVTIYAARGDRDVPIANAEYCQEILRSLGADVRLIDVGDVDHSTSVMISLPLVLEQFDSVG